MTRGVAKAAGVAIVCDTCSLCRCRLSSAMFVVSDGTQLTPLTPRIRDYSIVFPHLGSNSASSCRSLCDTIQEHIGGNKKTCCTIIIFPHLSGEGC